LFRIGEEPVEKSEFKYAFLKNYRPSDSISLEEEVMDYLDLYVKFKLKVKEAKARGYHQRDSYIRELSSYQKDLAKPYLTENKVTDQLIQEAYDRMKLEIKASHILIDANKDSAAAKKKILEIKELAAEGLSFDSLAAIYSTDPSAKNNGGNLGYFSSMQMVYPFESAAYNTAVNNISEVVTTRFGYHILKVFDKRPAQGQVKVAHIMLRSSPTAQKQPNKASKEKEKQLEKKIQAIYDEVIAGKDWTQLVKDFSQDARSKNQGGELPWLATGNFIPSFEKIAFSLEEKGEISKPFKTIYGWHIMKLVDKKGIGTLEERRDEIAKRIEKDSRSESKKQQVITKLKRENNFQKNNEAIEKIIIALETQDTVAMKNDVILFSLLDKQFRTSDFIAFTKENKSKESNYGQRYNQFEEKSIFNFFDIMEEEVWRKASKDSVGLKKFYDSNKSNYTKYNVKKSVIYISKESEAINEVEKYISEGLEQDEILTLINKDEPLLLQSSDGLFERGDNKIVDRSGDKEIASYQENEKYYLVHTLETVPQRIPDLDDIRGRLISNYQDELERNWVSELRSKYPVKINDEIVREVINEIENK